MRPACQPIRGRLEAYVDGELEPALAGEVRRHLATCPDCAEQHALAVSLPLRLRVLTGPAPPPGLLPGVMRQVAGPSSAGILSWGLLAAEAALVGLILAYLSGLDGVGRLAGATAGDVSQLLSWGLGAAPAPSPAATDLFLTLSAILLVAVCGVHIVVLGRPSGRRPA